MTDDKLLGSKRKNDGRCNPEFQALKLYLGIPVGLKGGNPGGFYRNMEIWHPLFEGFPIVRHGNTLECNTFFFLIYVFLKVWWLLNCLIHMFMETFLLKQFRRGMKWNIEVLYLAGRIECGQWFPFTLYETEAFPCRFGKVRSLEDSCGVSDRIYSKRYDSLENPLGLKSNSLNIISLRFFGNSVAPRVTFWNIPTWKMRPWGGEG